jgi:YggT family protein
MERIIPSIMGMLAMLIGIYSLLIIIRMILSWFGNVNYGRPMQILNRITDPYLNWWRQKINLRAGNIDLSPIVAIVALSVLQTICSTIAKHGGISLRGILAVCLIGLWSAVSFVLGFCLIVLILRFIAYIINANMFSIFWKTIDSISRPLLYHINRVIFGKRIVSFITGILTSIVILAILWIVGHFSVISLTDWLIRSFG